MTDLYFSDIWWRFLLLAVGGYLMGNVNFAVIISKIKHKDIRTMGSGNPGTLNMSRNFGLGVGILTLILDIIKGALPTFLGYYLFGKYSFADTGYAVGHIAGYIGGLFAVIGHIFPFWMHFHGGKGIATTIGVFAVVDIKVTAICGVIAIVFILITEMGSMGSFIATTPPAIVGIYKLFTVYNDNATLFLIGDLLVVGIISLTWYAHRVNIIRLLSGEEHETNWMQMIKDIKFKRKMKKLEKNCEK